MEKNSITSKLFDRIKEIMHSENCVPARLSARMGRTPAFVTVTLKRNSNITVSTLASMVDALGYEIEFNFKKKGEMK